MKKEELFNFQEGLSKLIVKKKKKMKTVEFTFSDLWE
jgi:hypothetical protein